MAAKTGKWIAISRRIANACSNSAVWLPLLRRRARPKPSLVLTPPRRITLYWFLLLVPTLVVGGAVIQLLRREQSRIAEQSAQALEARRATIAARARLTVETIELLVGDVEEGLLDTLA